MFRCLVLVAAAWVAVPNPVQAQNKPAAPSLPISAWQSRSWPDYVIRILRDPVITETLFEAILDQLGTVTYDPTTVKVFVGLPQATGKLEVLKFDGHVVLEGRDSSWWGDNHVKLRVPCEFRFEVDLKALQPQDVVYDTSKNLVKVKMPQVRQCTPTFQLVGVEVTEKTNPFFRSRASWLELKEKVMRENVSDYARVLGETKMSEAHLTGRALLQDFLRRTYAPVKPGVTVVVD